MTNNYKLLVVDDTPVSLKLLSDILKAEGYEVRAAINGEMAIDFALRNTPDLVLLDIMMPGIDGFEVCRRLKAHAPTRNVPILFISALSDTCDKVQGFGLGAVDYVTKPYQREELLARVRTHLEIDRLRNHLEEMVAERSKLLVESEKKLKQSLEQTLSINAQLNTLLNTIPDLVWLKDANGVYQACNLQFERLYGAKEAEIVGKTDYDFVDRHFADFFREHDRKAISADKTSVNEEWLTFASDGQRRLFETLKTPMSDQAGNLIGILGIARDITERKASQAKIQRHMQLYAALSRCNKAIVHCKDEEALFTEICQAAVQLGGMQMAWVGLIDPETRWIKPIAYFGEGTDTLQQMEISLDSNSPFGQGPTGNAIRTGQPFWCQDFMNDPVTLPWRDHAARSGWKASASLPLQRDGSVIGALILYADQPNAFDDDARELLIEMSTDIDFALENFAREIARQHAEAEIERLAFYDPLTNLPNRRLLYDRLRQAIAANARHNSHGAALFIDLDNFKALNDTKGHNIGDLLLIEIAECLQHCVRDGDTVARLGGDEFIMILNGLSGELTLASSQAKKIGNKILSAISQPCSLLGFEHRCSASMGISLFRNKDMSVEELLKCTDIALYQAKRKGRNTLLFYDPAMQAALEIRTTLENDLRRALDAKQLTLYYQMQVDQVGQICGAEVLLRWIHPERGLVSPMDFIPLAEETGLILPIGKWVIDSACAQLKLWEADPVMSKLQLAVNVSAPQFHQAAFVDQVRQTLNRYTLNPDRLKLELTESLVLDDVNDTTLKMQQLREIGVLFSMDDFGTGYSSLSYLTKLPIDQLKIDQSFVRNIKVTQSDAIIVQTIIGMANNLGIECIAEGVEIEDQRDFLARHGCNHYQGYLFGRPEPLAEFQKRFGKE